MTSGRLTRNNYTARDRSRAEKSGRLLLKGYPQDFIKPDLRPDAAALPGRRKATAPGCIYFGHKVISNELIRSFSMASLYDKITGLP